MSLEWIIGCVVLAFVILLIILAGVLIIAKHILKTTFALDDYEPYGECPAPQGKDRYGLPSVTRFRPAPQWKEVKKKNEQR